MSADLQRAAEHYELELFAERGRQAQAAGDEAIERVQRNAAAEWVVAAEDAIAHVARMQPEFTTDDVWDRLDALGVPAPHEPRALGAVMRSAGQLGHIFKTDRTQPSRRVECHGRDLRLWRTL